VEMTVVKRVVFGDQADGAHRIPEPVFQNKSVSGPEKGEN
jgi:hypothetical protein